MFTWDPGDGNDVVEGQDGHDTLLFNGANVSENIDIMANGARVLLFRNVANVTMDIDGMRDDRTSRCSAAPTTSWSAT